MKKRYISIFLAAMALAAPSKAKIINALGSERSESVEAMVRPQRVDTLSGVLRDYLLLKLNPNDMKSIDTVSILYNKYIGELDYLNDPATPRRYIPDYPQYYRLFVPLAYYYSPIARLSTVDWQVPDCSAKEVDYSEYLPAIDSRLTAGEASSKLVDKTLMDVYINNPSLVKTTEESIMSKKLYRKDVVQKQDKAQATKLFQIDKPEASGNAGESSLLVRKPNWWKIGGSGSLQITQNYISDNWYKGGESNNAVVANLTLYANYNDNEKVQWENLFEGKLGFNSAPSDTYHDYLISADQMRFYTKLGLQAAKNWYYTASAEFKTQFCDNYKSNSETPSAAFLAPADVNVGLGMDYKLKKKKVNFSLVLSPLTYTLRYVGGDRVSRTSYGIEEGKRTSTSFGSEVTPTLSWTVCSAITFDTRIDYLTSYEWVRVEWESTFNFVLNKYLSTKLYVHARFDDSAAPTVGNSHFQVKEMLSFGLNYTW
jgi:hypothetical protein